MKDEESLTHFYMQLALDSLDRFTHFLIPKDHPKKIEIKQAVAAKISSSHLAILDLKKNISGYRRINLELNNINKINKINFFSADDLKTYSDSVDSDIPHLLSFGWFQEEKLFPVWVFTDDLKEKIINRTQQYQSFIIYASKPPKSYLPKRITLSHSGRVFCFDKKLNQLNGVVFANPIINEDKITLSYDYL